MTTSSKKQNSILKIIRSNKLFPKILESVLPDGEHTPTKMGKKGLIPALAKTDEMFQQLLIHPNEKVRTLCQARQTAKSWPTHVKRIQSMINQSKCKNGLLPVALHYYGAHTGRWSGGEKINLQNLGGRGRAGSGNHPLIGKVRGLLQAPDGYVLSIADSSQIEARILAWFADQQDLVQGFANGDDIYSVFATKLFKSYVAEPLPSDPKPVYKILKVRRGFGKDAILGAGYGMGANKFYDNCRANNDLRPMFDSGEYDWNFIDKLIKTYRSTYSKIPEFWKAVEKAFKWAIKYPNETIAVGCNLRFENHNGTVHIILPSGRRLFYRHCALKRTKMGSEIRWHWGYLYGAAITENIVQSISRDLLGYWILKAERSGLSVAMHTHDEYVCVVLEDQADKKLQQMLDIMCSIPKWADGLPVNAKGKISKCYVK